VILLDTATWIWLATDRSKLSATARTTIETHDEIFVSSVSAWEVGMLVAKGRITLDRPVDRWVDDAMRQSYLTPVPVDHHIGALATLLPSQPPTDPADRLIIATALKIGAIMITPDEEIRNYPYCPTVW
jgi:PIN domain nuclease of toxin-antitoxin system